MIVATNAFGMGVDKADVRSVWHMAIPTSLEAYYQEAGRGGRDGLPARAVLLAMKADLGRLVRFIEQRDPELAIARERGWRDYRTIKSFIYGERCRRRSMLDHFGDREAGPAAGPLLRRLRRAELAARPGDDRGAGAEAGAKARPPRRPSSRDADAPLFEAAEGLAPAAPPPASPPTRSPTTRPWRRSPRRGPSDEASLGRRSAASAPASSPSTPPKCCRSSAPRSAELNADRAVFYLRHDLPADGPVSQHLRLRSAGREGRAPAGRIRLG